jgi:hypothetical protein
LNPLKAKGQGMGTLIFLFIEKVFVPKEIHQSSERGKASHHIPQDTDM